MPKRRVDAINNLREMFGKDPNVALVGIRIEIEKRLNLLAELNGIEMSNKSLRYKLQRLEQLGVVPPEVSSGLNDLVSMGNKAAHGADVAPEVAAWVMDNGPQVISILDEIIDTDISLKGRTKQDAPKR